MVFPFNTRLHQIQVSLLVICALMFLANHSVVQANEDSSLVAYPAVISALDNTLELDINSLHQSWSIQLRQKSLLGSLSSAQNALYDVPEFFNGTVIGESQSWVRLARDSATSALTGHIFSKGTLYELQYRDDMGGHAVARLADSESIQPDAGIPDITDFSVNGKAIVNDPLPLTKAIRVGIVVDSRYNEQHNGRGLAHALGVMNGVDGLYQNQLGLALVVESFRVYDEPDTDPLRELTGTADGLLEQYRQIRIQDSELSNDLALVHLFSGHRESEDIIGLGWISTACSTNGYDLSLSTPFPYDILLAAHEIAHNLGAVHDDDAQCTNDSSITGAEVMWSELSGSTRPTFSSCSLIELRQTTNSADCVADNIDLKIALGAAFTADSDQVAVQVAVLNQDFSRRASQIRSLTTFPPGTALANPSAGCSIQGATLNCLHETVNAQQESRLSVNASFNHIINPVITAELKLVQFMDTRHQDNRAAIQLDTSDLIAGGFVPANLSASTASGGSAANDPANDQGMPTAARGGSAGIAAGGMSKLMLLMLSLFLLPAIRSKNTATGAELV